MIHRFLLVVSIAFLSCVGACAAEANLKGVWESSYKVAFPNGIADAHSRLVITGQDGANFYGYVYWEQTRMTQANGAVSTKKLAAREGIAGVIDFDGKTITMVQTEGGGTYWAKIQGSNKLSVVFTQADKTYSTLAYRAVFARVSK